MVHALKLSYDGGGLMCPSFLFIFLLKISPPDQTLRPTCKFLILGIFYHAKKIWKFSIWKVLLNTFIKNILGRGGGSQSVRPIFVCEDRAIAWAIFSRIYLSICNLHIRSAPPPIITKLNYVKNGPLQNHHSTIFLSTKCIILLLFLLFSQIKMGGGHF